MKKANVITLFLLCCSMIFVMIYSTVVSMNKQEDQKVVSVVSKKPEKKKEEIQQKEEVKKEDVREEPKKEEQVQERVEPMKMDDALFIGDSRTVGLMEYSQMEGAQYFCNVGMSVFNIYDQVVSMDSIGRVSLETLLMNKQYQKIYVMLGINEMGYRFEYIVDQYKKLVKYIEQKQPQASIIIQGNLHVTKSRSDNDPTFNNANINKLNQAIERFANKKNIYYIDVNPVFDDASGALAEEKSEDKTHLYAKYYVDWGTWICQRSAQILKG